jgi:hypothetical protein
MTEHDVFALSTDFMAVDNENDSSRGSASQHGAPSTPLPVFLSTVQRVLSTVQRVLSTAHRALRTLFRTEHCFFDRALNL